MFDYQVRLIPFPSGKVHESVTRNEDSSYTIFIDVNLPREGQRQRFLHALKHIMQNDFDMDDADKIERLAHKLEFSSEIAPVS